MVDNDPKIRLIDSHSDGHKSTTGNKKTLTLMAYYGT